MLKYNKYIPDKYKIYSVINLLIVYKKIAQQYTVPHFDIFPFLKES